MLLCRLPPIGCHLRALRPVRKTCPLGRPLREPEFALWLPIGADAEKWADAGSRVPPSSHLRLQDFARPA